MKIFKVMMMGAILLIAINGFAREFRNFVPILTPKKVPKGFQLASTPVENVSLMKKSVKEIFKSWKQGNFEKYLSEDFYDKRKLLDAMSYKVPPSAKIRVLSIKNMQTLQQFQKYRKDGSIEVYSTVSVTADTQIEFDDVHKGFRRLEGENEYIIQIKGELIPEK